MKELFIELRGQTVDSILEECKSDKTLRLRNIPLTSPDLHLPLEDHLNRVIHNLHAYIYFFISFGFVLNKPGKNYLKEVSALRRTAFSWLALDLNCKLENYLKFHTSWLFAKYADQDKHADLPTSSLWTTPGCFMCGPFQKWIKNRLHDSGKYQLFFSLMQVKSGCAPLQLPSVVDATIKHANLLVEEKTSPEPVLGTIIQMGTMIGKMASKQKQEFKVPVPSSKACFQRSINEGGSKVEIHDYLSRDLHQKEHLTNIELWDDSVAQASVAVRANDDAFGLLNLHSSIPDIDIQDEEVLIYDIKTSQSTGNPNRNWEIIQTKLVLQSQMGIPFRASVVAIPEPFKVRIITKSDAFLNYYGKPMQKILHRTVKQTRWGFAIGRPVETSDVQCFSCLKEDEFIVSGDYESATDNLNTDASLTAVSAILSKLNLSEEIRTLFDQMVSANIIDYNKTIDSYKNDPRYAEEKLRLPPTFEQKKGQLMGSILSFPILCILNMATFVHTCRVFYNDPWYTVGKACKNHHLMINGDDILFKATKQFIELWKEFTTSIGLKPSLGKNYVSRQFFTINSMLFVRRENEDGVGVITYEPRLNMGLLFAPNPLCSDSKVVVSPLTYGDSASSIQAEFLKENYAEDQYLSWLYLHVNKPYLEKASYGRNWFIPKHLGGLGLKTKEDMIEYNKIQGRVAAYLMTRAKPEQIWEASLNFKDTQPDLSTMKAIRQVKELGKVLGWTFYESSLTSTDADRLLQELMSLDPFGGGDSPLEVQLEVSRISRRIYSTMRKLSNEVGSLELPKPKTMVDDTPRIVGLKLPYGILSNQERSVYAPKGSYNQ